MRTLVIIAVGLVLVAIYAFAGRMLGGNSGMVLALKIFIPLWLAVAGINMWFGVAKAGYSVMEELPIFLVIFALPAAAAGFVWWKFS